MVLFFDGMLIIFIFGLIEMLIVVSILVRILEFKINLVLILGNNV